MLSILVGDGLEKKKEEKYRFFFVLFGFTIATLHLHDMRARAVVTLYLKLFFVAGGLNDWQSG